MWDPWRAALFGQLAPRRLNLDLVWATLAFVGALAILIVTLAWVERWRKRSMSDRGGPADELSQYRALFEQGLLSSEEYERIRRRLEGRVPSPPAQAPPTQAAPSPPAKEAEPLPPAESSTTDTGSS
jgi:hypothetical protein